MKRVLLLTLACVAVLGMKAQTTVLDFEAAATSTLFQYFGSSLDGTKTTVIANPDASGINVSDSVMRYVKAADAQTWAGAVSNPNPTTAIDLVSGSNICLQVWMPAAGNVALKLENSGTAANWIQQQSVATGGQWVEICFDPTQPSIEAPFETAAGNIYPQVVLFFDFGTAGNGTNDVVYYFDNLIVNPAAATCNTVLDFEAPATSTLFQYFGSSLDGSKTTVIVNPDASGINVSDSVTRYVKAADAQTWAGAVSNPNPTTAIDLVTGTEICLSVWLPAAGNVALKLENSGTAANWIQQQSIATGGQWVQVCFDPSQPSIEAPFETAAGNIYPQVVLFFDFGTAGNGTNDVIYYFDDLCVLSGSGPEPVDVDFAVNMADYTGTFTTVYVSGTFNNWSGDANPLSDSDNDGIWTGTVSMLPGNYEFKYTLDNWTVQEEFAGTEECIILDASGQFKNRRLPVLGATTLSTSCFNSCYNCGEGRSITFNVGFSGVTPNPEGVFIAGGLAFGAAPNAYRLTDDDNDGVYSITFERGVGFNSFYTFTNGPCADYSCKEDISGQACANPDNFNDRLIPAISGDTTINTCFGICSDNTNCTVGITRQELPQWFTVVPTQTSRYTEIRLEQPVLNTAHFRVLNITGQVVQTGRIDGTMHMLDLGQAPAGVYLLQVEAGALSGTRRLIKY